MGGFEFFNIGAEVGPKLDLWRRIRLSIIFGRQLHGRFKTAEVGFVLFGSVAQMRTGRQHRRAQKRNIIAIGLRLFSGRWRASFDRFCRILAQDRARRGRGRRGLMRCRKA